MSDTTTPEHEDRREPELPGRRDIDEARRSAAAEKRIPPTRAEDAYLKGEHAAITSLAKVGRIAAGAAAIAMVIGATLGFIGYKRWGPAEQLALEITARVAGDDALALRVTRLESVADTMNKSINGLREEARFQSYLLCVVLRKIDPVAEPPGCTRSRP